MQEVGKYIIVLGLLLLVVGIILYLGWGKAAFGWMGRLPGDIRIEGKGGGFYFPVVTSIVLSVVLTLVVQLVMWLRGR